MVVYILPFPEKALLWLFAIQTVSTLVHIWSWVRITGGKVSEVECLVSMPAVRVLVSSALTICFGFSQ